LLEESPVVYENLKKTAASLKGMGLHIECVNALHYLKATETPFDIIFLDPPFSSAGLKNCLSIIHKGQCLVKGGLIYVESGEALSASQNLFSVIREKKAGQVFYGLLQSKT
jgi:16S rRNA (guanine966-N2)-methyltransferase